MTSHHILLIIERLGQIFDIMTTVTMSIRFYYGSWILIVEKLPLLSYPGLSLLYFYQNVVLITLTWHSKPSQSPLISGYSLQKRIYSLNTLLRFHEYLMHFLSFPCSNCYSYLMAHTPSYCVFLKPLLYGFSFWRWGVKSSGNAELQHLYTRKT